MNHFKDFLIDRKNLFLALVSLLLVFFNFLLVVIQINSTKTVAVIRSNIIDGQDLTRGDTRSLYVFALAPILFFCIHVYLAIKAQASHKAISYSILGLGIVILIFSIIVSSLIIQANK